jgi:hypothetical protein
MRKAATKRCMCLGDNSAYLGLATSKNLGPRHTQTHTHSHSCALTTTHNIASRKRTSTHWLATLHSVLWISTYSNQCEFHGRNVRKFGLQSTSGAITKSECHILAILSESLASRKMEGHTLAKFQCLAKVECLTSSQIGMPQTCGAFQFWEAWGISILQGCGIPILRGVGSAHTSQAKLECRTPSQNWNTLAKLECTSPSQNWNHTLKLKCLTPRKIGVLHTLAKLGYPTLSHKLDPQPHKIRIPHTLVKLECHATHLRKLECHKQIRWQQLSLNWWRLLANSSLISCRVDCTLCATCAMPSTRGE